MAIYSFRIKKGKYQLDLSTTDKELLVEQFELWVKQAGAYNKKRKAKECKEMVDTQIKAEEEVTKKNIEKHTAKNPVPELPKIDKKLLKEEKIEKTEKEDVIDKSLDIFYAPPVKETVSEIMEKSSSTGVFDNILESIKFF